MFKCPITILWQLINIFNEFKWNRLLTDENNYFFQRCMAQYFVIKPTTEPNSKEASIAPTSFQAASSISIPSSNIPIVSSWPSKKFLAKLKQLKLQTGTNNKKSYA